MKKRIKHNKFVIGLAVVALAAASILWSGGSLQSVAAASGQDGSVRFVSYACIGITPSQMLRLSVANTTNAVGTPITWTYTVTNSGGVPLYESDKMPVPAGGFAGRDILVGGWGADREPRTGRVQMLVKIVIEAPAGSKPADCPVSLEIINSETGATTVLSGGGSYSSGYVKVSGDGD